MAATSRGLTLRRSPSSTPVRTSPVSRRLLCTPASAVRTCASQRLEPGASLGDRIEDVEQVARRARQAIEAGDDYHVAGVKLLQQLTEFGPIGLRTARRLAKHFRAAGFGELLHLGVTLWPSVDTHA